MNKKSNRVVCIIPARGGSKGIPQKNVRLLAGKPLIAYTIDAALGARSISEVYVSTDDSAIASAAIKYGAQVIDRPVMLATDAASSESALRHAIDIIDSDLGEIEFVVFLQCTSPFRSSDDIEQAIANLRKEDADSLLSVVPSYKFLWKVEAGKVVSVNYDYRNRPRRQDMAPQYLENGSIYIFKPWVLRQFDNRLGGKVIMYVMREDQVLDIDTESDWLQAEMQFFSKL